MQLLVCVSEVFHPLDLRLPADGGRPEGCRMPNRADECAVELAVRLRAQGGGRVTAVSVAPPDADETLDGYAGLGADVLLRVWDTVLGSADAAVVARVLARVVEAGAAEAGADFELVLCGDRAFGGEGSGLTGPALAERLGWPFAGGIVAVERAGEGGIVVERLIERGDRQILELPLPAVVAVSPDADPPRYPALARMRRAAREVRDLRRLGLPPEEIRQATSVAQLTGWTAARPRPRKLFTPPSTASAADRLRMVMGGGRPASRPAQESVLEAPPDKAAEQILQFLRQEGFLPPPS